jgi:DNA-binding MltR family transcriptional regulator
MKTLSVKLTAILANGSISQLSAVEYESECLQSLPEGMTAYKFTANDDLDFYSIIQAVKDIKIFINLIYKAL